MRLKTKFQDEDFDLGEVVNANIYYGGSDRIKIVATSRRGGEHSFYYESLKELSKMFEDAPEEPKEYWFIDEFGLVQKEIEYYYEDNKEAVHDKRITVGNYFETKEEAEKAVEKLKALTKLCKKGFEFNSVEMFGSGLIRIEASIPINEKTTLQERSNITDSLYLLFGGEE